MYSSGWRREALGPVASGLIELRGEETLQHLKRLGVRVSPGNRLETAVGLLRDLNEGRELLTPDDAELIHRTLEGFRTIWEAFLITHTILSRKKTELYGPQYLNALVRGAESSMKERDPRPRSTQLEMLAATKLLLGGADVRMEEPDLTFLYHKARLGGAVKRITRNRAETVARAVASAVDQLRRNELPGFVILSLDPFVDGIETALSAGEFGEDFNRRVVEAHRSIEGQALNEERFLLGAIVLGHHSRMDFSAEPPRLEWAEATQFLRFTDDADEIAKAKEFFGPLGDRLWNNMGNAAQLLMRGE